MERSARDQTCRRGTHLLVEVAHRTVRYSVRDAHGQPLTLRLYDEVVEIRPGEPVERPVVPLARLLPAPPQPPGHEPLSHGWGMA
jgi:alpha,alpha-trehalose phosphorylase